MLSWFRLSWFERWNLSSTSASWTSVSNDHNRNMMSCSRVSLRECRPGVGFVTVTIITITITITIIIIIIMMWSPDVIRGRDWERLLLYSNSFSVESWRVWWMLESNTTQSVVYKDERPLTMCFFSLSWLASSSSSFRFFSSILFLLLIVALFRFCAAILSVVLSVLALLSRPLIGTSSGEGRGAGGRGQSDSFG